MAQPLRLAERLELVRTSDHTGPLGLTSMLASARHASSEIDVEPPNPEKNVMATIPFQKPLYFDAWMYGPTKHPLSEPAAEQETVSAREMIYRGTRVALAANDAHGEGHDADLVPADLCYRGARCTVLVPRNRPCPTSAEMIYRGTRCSAANRD